MNAWLNYPINRVPYIFWKYIHLFRLSSALLHTDYCLQFQAEDGCLHGLVGLISGNIRYNTGGVFVYMALLNLNLEIYDTIQGEGGGNIHGLVGLISGNIRFNTGGGQERKTTLARKYNPPSPPPYLKLNILSQM